MKKALLAVLLSSCIALGGCALIKKSAPIPGAVNAFDSDTYLSLVTAKAVIDQAKADLASNLFPSSIAPNVKLAVNGAVTAYNVADVAYQQYHSSAVAGSSTAAQVATVNQSMANLQAAVNSVTAAKGGH